MLMWTLGSAVGLWLLLAVTAYARELDVTSAAASRNGPCTHKSYTVPNGGFQSGQLGPWEPGAGSNGVNISVISTRASADGYAVRLQAIDDGTGFPSRGALTLDNVTVCAATTYNLSFVYSSPGTTPSCTAYVTAVGYGIGGSSTQWTYPNLTKTNGFQKASLLFNVTNGNAYNIYLLLACDVQHPQGPAAIDFDRFELRAVGSLEPPGCPNRDATLTNGDFETGAIAPWELSLFNNLTTASVVHSPHDRRHGNYYLQVNFSNSPSDPPSGDAGFDLVQAIPDLCLAYNYDISFDYRWTSPRLDEIPATSVSFYVIIDSCGAIPIPPGNGTWQTSSTKCSLFRSGNSTLNASFFIGWGDGQPAYPSFAIDLDNISFRLSRS